MIGRSTSRRGVAVTLALLAGLATAARGQSIRAEIDRNEATLEERLVLTVTVVGSGTEPRLPELPQFDVVAAGQERQWSFVNGRASTSFSYRFLLLPQAEGEFVIGPATVEIDGSTYASDPFTVRIVPAASAPRQSQDLFATARLSTTNPYAGQQVLFVWRLYRRVGIADARLDPFEFNGFLVEDLGEVREFETTVNGRRYLVSELRKALFPQEQGELTVPATRLSCQVPSARRRRGASLFDDVFGRAPTEPRLLRTEPIAVQVRPLPPAPPGFSGLVGRFDLSTTASQTDVRVGESLTLALEITGSGNVQMIPEPRLPELPSFKVYDDKPSSNVERRPAGLTGSKTYRKALVPQRAGELSLPALRLVYFDPEAGEFVTARTAEIPLRVSPAEGREELKLTETVAPSTGKVAVRILAEDILPLYAGLDAVTGHRAPRPALLATALALPALLYAAAWVTARRRRRFREDKTLERRQRARARAWRRLKRLRSGGGAEELSRCLREFIGDKLGLEGIALTPAEAQATLGERGLDPETADRVGGILERLEATQYAAAPLDVDGLGREVAELVRRLDREL